MGSADIEEREREVETEGRENDCRQGKIMIEKENGNDGREKGRQF